MDFIRAFLRAFRRLIAVSLRPSLHLVPLLVIALGTIAAVSCGGSNTAATTSVPTMTSVVIMPANATIAVDQPVTFSVTITYSDGSTQTLQNDDGLTGADQVNTDTDAGTPNFVWSTSDETGATISLDPDGTVTGVAPGTVTLTVSVSPDALTTSTTLTASTMVTIVPNNATTLTSIKILPSPANVPIGIPLQLAATASYSDGTTEDISDTGFWTEGDISIASVEPSSGLVSGVAVGSTTVSITDNETGATQSVVVNVTQVQSVTVSPPTATVAAGLVTFLTATANVSDGSTPDVTAVAHWTSSDPTVALVDQLGNVKGVKAGTVTITASIDAISIAGTATVTVTGSADAGVTDASVDAGAETSIDAGSVGDAFAE